MRGPYKELYEQTKRGVRVNNIESPFFSFSCGIEHAVRLAMHLIEGDLVFEVAAGASAVGRARVVRVGPRDRELGNVRSTEKKGDEQTSVRTRAISKIDVAHRVPSKIKIVN